MVWLSDYLNINIVFFQINIRMIRMSEHGKKRKKISRIDHLITQSNNKVTTSCIYFK